MPENFKPLNKLTVVDKPGIRPSRPIDRASSKSIAWGLTPSIRSRELGKLVCSCLGATARLGAPALGPQRSLAQTAVVRRGVPDNFRDMVDLDGRMHDLLMHRQPLAHLVGR